MKDSSLKFKVLFIEGDPELLNTVSGQIDDEYDCTVIPIDKVNGYDYSKYDFILVDLNPQQTINKLPDIRTKITGKNLYAFAYKLDRNVSLVFQLGRIGVNGYLNAPIMKSDMTKIIADSLASRL